MPRNGEEYDFSIITMPRYVNGKAAMLEKEFNASFKNGCHLDVLREGVNYYQSILDWFDSNWEKLEQLANVFPAYDLVKINKQKQVEIRIPNRALFDQVSEIALRLWPSHSTDNTRGDFVYLYIPFKED